MRKVGNDIRTVVMDEQDIIEFETKECRIVSFKNKYYLQIYTDIFGWVFALESGKELKAKEYSTYNLAMKELLKWEKKKSI